MKLPLCLALFIASAAPAAVRVVPAGAEGAGTSLPVRAVGRAERTIVGWVRQWPGTYFETAFRGASAAFKVGAGDVRLHVLVDGAPAGTLVKPAPGLYRVEGLAPGRHRLRVEVASESQAGPTGFGGFFAGAGARPAPLTGPARQIEFIGDSHTVGYGNTSPTTDCTQDQVWAATDTSQAFGPVLARRYGADYEINAISGRGVVRNYDGFAADTMPQAYPYMLFNKAHRAHEPGWRPQLIVMALGTNDFTTALHPGEKWRTRDELHADYERTYTGLVKGLRARNPRALVVLWATDMANGEIEAEASRVVAHLRTAGDRRVLFVPVDGLSFSGCHAHPSVADDRIIADRLAQAVDGQAGVWR